MEGRREIHERTFVLVSGSTSHMRDIAVGYIEGVKMGQLGEKRGTRRAVQGCTSSRRRSGPGTLGRTLISESMSNLVLYPRLLIAPPESYRKRGFDERGII
jgi:hypothetical protein